MSRYAMVIVVLILVASAAVAQDSTPKVEVFGGYSLLRADSGGLNSTALDAALGAPSGAIGVPSTFNGWNAEVQYNAKPWLGIVADFSGHYGAPITSTSSGGVSGLPNGNSYSFLFGPVLSYKTKMKLTPFVHALFGVDHASLAASDLTGLSFSSSGSATDNAFAMALGGGLDYTVSRHLAIRLGQVDYLYTGHDLNSFYGMAYGPGSFSGLATHQNNLRFSTGIVLRF